MHSYTLTMRKQRKSKETISFTIETKIIKYLGINLSKEPKDLYTGNYKHWWMKSKMTKIDGEIDHIHGLEDSI